ncbi:MAG: hypothetical protein EXX96DRAFT_541587 [Benjaminiella poitrasii]|nr:MAG: hypothetical protein EXX96DRAFT_541587 [Benjaminiella poitrasii]
MQAYNQYIVVHLELSSGITRRVLLSQDTIENYKEKLFIYENTNMNIQTLTSPSTTTKAYKTNNKFLNACPSNDAGLLRYATSPKNKYIDSISNNDLSPFSPSFMPSKQQLYQSPSSSQQQKDASDLQTVVSKYQTNPELLKLILTSKVEEDKRKAEEAKLKAKELDIYFKKRQKELKSKKMGESTLHRNRVIPYPIPNNNTNNSNSNNRSTFIIPPPLPRRNSSASTLLSNIHNTMTPVSSGLQLNRPNTSILSTSAPDISNPYLYSSQQQPSLSHRLSADYNTDNRNSITATNNYNGVKLTRRRRSMQAITKIVETTEFPYNDGYFWKNNGNTVQKKTGCKSVYYKCANSSKGCPVNKTVVEQLDGSYIIKYRSEHIPDCSKVEHIRDL